MGINVYVKKIDEIYHVHVTLAIIIKDNIVIKQ